MNKGLLAIAAVVGLGCVVLPALAGPPGGRPVAATGYYPGGAYRPFYAGYRPLYPGWRGGYWGPGAGLYVGGPGYWGAWPYGYGYGYGWGAAYAAPFAVAPLVVNTAPAPQVIVQAPSQPGEAPATSYWYYCTQPAGYFPYVQDCSQAWMKVVPQVPGSTVTPPRLAP